MAYIMAVPLGYQFEDANGLPLVGGTLEFYVTGTSTATPIYFDSAGASSATTVTLNSLGRPQTSGGTATALFFDDSVTYKLIIKDSSGVAIDPTYDPFNVVNSAGGQLVVDSVASLYGSDNSSFDYATTQAFTSGGNKGGAEWYKGTSGGTQTTVGTLYTDLAQGYVVDAGGNYWHMKTDTPLTPAQFGAIGDAKIWSGDDLIQNASPTDDTDALVAYMSAENQRNVYLPEWYAVYPTASGNTRSLGIIPDGFIRPNITYIVEATSGSVTYNGTAYTNGQTFDGSLYHEGYTASGDAVVRLYMPVALEVDRSTNSDGDGRQVRFFGSGGLIAYDEGVAVAVYGEDSTNDFIYNAEFKEIRVERYTGLANTSAVIGAYFESLVFNSEIEYAYFGGCDIGLIHNNCWNMHFDHLNVEGSGFGDIGVMGINSNSQTVNHIFTHNYRSGCVVEFVSAHSASVGNTLRVAFDSTYYWTGIITDVVDANTVVCRDVSRTTGTTVGVWQGDIDSGTDIDVKDARLLGGIGYLLSNPDGLQIYGDFQNKGEAGIVCLVDGSSGNIGLQLYGHNEGPANGLIVKPTPNAVSPLVTGIECNMGGFAGRTNSSSNFGRTHNVWLQNVDEGKVDDMYVQNRDNSGLSGWAASTAYSVGDLVRPAWGVYRCTGAGTSAASGIGPTGTGTGITDNTATWEFLRYPSACILIESSCNNVHVGQQITYNHNVGTAHVIDLQDKSGKGQNCDHIDYTPPTLASGSGITSDVSATDIQVDNLGDSRRPTGIEVEVSVTVNSFNASSDSVAIWLRSKDGNSNSRKFARFNNLVTSANYSTYLTIPCTEYGEITYSVDVASAAIDIDYTIKQVGAYY